MPAYTDRLLSAIADEKRSPREPKVLVKIISGVQDSQQPDTIQFIEPLSEHELEVLRLLTTSLSGTEIAEELYIAPSTVRSHTENIYRKLDVHNRGEAVKCTGELGII